MSSPPIIGSGIRDAPERPEDERAFAAPASLWSTFRDYYTRAREQRRLRSVDDAPYDDADSGEPRLPPDPCDWL